MYVYEIDGESCPECGAKAMYGTKEKASSWKVFVMCEHSEDLDKECTWDIMAGSVLLADIDHRDEVEEQAVELAKRFTA